MIGQELKILKSFLQSIKHEIEPIKDCNHTISKKYVHNKSLEQVINFVIRLEEGKISQDYAEALLENYTDKD